MKYRLIVRKIEKNENFMAERAEWEEKNKWNRMNRNDYYDPSIPQEEVTTDALVIELNEEQFKKLKEQSFKVFE